MKFIVNCIDFKNLIGTASRGLVKQPNARAVMQIVGGEESPELKVTCQTGSSFFQGKIAIHSIDNYEEKVWGLEYDKIKSVLSVLPEVSTNLVFSSPDEDGQTLSLDYLGNHINVKFYQDVQMPRLHGEIVRLGRIDSVTFMKSISSMLKLVENNQVAVDLATGCLHFSLEDGKVITMATNRYSTAEMKIPFEQEEGTNFEAMKMIKLEQGNLLVKSPEPNEVLELISVGNMLGYIDGRGVINLVALANIRPLDYQVVIEAASEDNFAILSSGSLKTALTDIGKLNPLEEEATLEISAEDTFVRTRQDSLEVEMAEDLIERNEETEEEVVVAKAHNLEDVHELNFHRPTTMDIFGLLSSQYTKLGWETGGDRVKFLVLDNNLQPNPSLVIVVAVHG